ncbi:uncharacterized protein LACBIDRAFT_293975 [Laccaria bicolor S238N-H82]|uniref:Predicted protein n=1 Tax=Laccaria bicolor (strain S238N-H82 / ATCC MYA-4686) TaxID=486041 RepID=B0D813_LACBS|nr:uncharacterized protein LACBIDRAFT_293975 [Laccaria bicolor S238N-H82]EDR09499.1 predicted protein [Laccaria bicolor S238N-H82]|eukprot:XP_001879848.1 predicted protein [Laccaria bicolor S238N-H82]
MLRTRLPQTCRSVVSTSQCTYNLHTAAVLRAQASRRSGGSTRKVNLANKEGRRKDALANRPSFILGTRPSDEAEKWRNSNLAGILVDEVVLSPKSELPTTTEMELRIGKVSLPNQIGFGLGDSEKKMLFNDLPVLSAQAMTLATVSRPYDVANDAAASHQFWEETELRKANMFAKVLDLRNANAAGIAFENRRRIIVAFSTPENPFSPGRAEVQAALKTYKIRKLWSHLQKFKRDSGNRLGLRKLIHERAKILRYLRSVDRDRYETVLERLALEPESVEGELVV